MDESIAKISSTVDTNQLSLTPKENKNSNISNSNSSNNNSTNIPKSSKITTTHMDITDSEDDSDIHLDKNDNYFANLNVSDQLKNILRYKDLDKSDDSDNSDDQSDFFSKSSILKSPKNTQPFLPSTTSNIENDNNNKDKNKYTPTITAATKTRLPDIEQQPDDRASRFQQLLGKIMIEDDSSDDNDDINKNKKKKKLKKLSGPKKKPTTTKGPTKKTKRKKKSDLIALNSIDFDDEENDESMMDEDEGDDNNDASSTTLQKQQKRKTSKGEKNRKNNEPRSTIALLDDSTDEDEDDDYGKPKQLSKKAQMEMYRENQRLKRSAEVKLRPTINRKTIDDLIRKVEMADLEQEEEDRRLREMTERRDNQLLQILRSSDDQDITQEEENGHDKVNNIDDLQDSDSDDSLIIVGKPEKRGDKIIKSVLTTMPSPIKSPWRKMMNMTTSPLQQRQYSPVNPLSMHLYNNMNNNKNKQPLDLKSLNRQLLDKIGKDQLSHRQEMIERAKAVGIYISPEERAKKLLEREHEAALIDMEVQQLLFKKTHQKFNNKSKNDEEDDDDDNDFGETIQLSGDEEDEDYDNSDEEDDDQLSLNDNSNNEDDSDSDGPTILKRKKHKLRKSTLLEDDEEEDINNKIPKAPEPHNSIMNFFNPKSVNKDKPKVIHIHETKAAKDENNESKSLTRLMQRTGISDQNDEKRQQISIDADADDEHANNTEEDLIVTSNNDNNDNDESDDHNMDKINKHKPASVSVPRPKEYNGYFEEEAEEEEDEYFGMGGPDVAETDDLDQFEEDGMLVEGNDENVDASELQAEYNRKMLESDQNMVQRLIKDITSGGLRRKRAAAAAGLLLDDYDLFDEYNEDDDLTAIRLREAFKRKKLLKGDPLQQLAANPKTAAFAKAAINMPVRLDLSDEEDNDDTMIANPINTLPTNVNKVIIHDDDDDDDI
ncbi:unnamed protein product [Cunninghamella echinulata]